MTYNETALQTATGLYDVLVFADDATGNVFIGLFVIGVFVSLLLIMKRFEFHTTLPSAGLICFVISLILSYAELLNFLYPLGFLLVTALSVLYLYLQK